MLNLKLQYFGHPMQRAGSLEKTLMLGKTEGRRRGQQRMRCLDSNTDTMEMNGRKLGDVGGQRSLACCNPRCYRVGHDLATEQQHVPVSPGILTLCPQRCDHPGFTDMKVKAQGMTAQVCRPLPTRTRASPIPTSPWACFFIW